MKKEHQKLLTAIVPKGTGRKVLLGLRREHGINTGNMNMARGTGTYNPLHKRGVGEQTEKEMITVVVSKDRADEIFEYIYDLAEIGEPHQGIIFQSDLMRSSTYQLPEGIEEEVD